MVEPAGVVVAAAMGAPEVEKGKTAIRTPSIQGTPIPHASTNRNVGEQCGSMPPEGWVKCNSDGRFVHQQDRLGAI